MALEYVELPGNGAKVLTDQVDTDKHAQVAKIGIGSDGVLPTLLAFGQGAKAASLPVTLASDEDPQKPRLIVATFGTLTRPANTTAYAANDAVSNNGTAGSVTAQSATVSDLNDAPFSVERLILDTTDTGLAAGKSVRAWLFNSDPTADSGVGGGDNAAWSQKRAGFIGSLSGTFRAFSDGGKGILVPDEGQRIIARPVSGAATLYFLLQTLDGWTPSANSTTIIPTLEGIQGRA